MLTILIRKYFMILAQELKHDGFFWVDDFHSADPLLILPFFVGFSTFLNIFVRLLFLMNIRNHSFQGRHWFFTGVPPYSYLLAFTSLYLVYITYISTEVPAVRIPIHQYSPLINLLILVCIFLLDANFINHASSKLSAQTNKVTFWFQILATFREIDG